jgi:hypothetical protein
MPVQNAFFCTGIPTFSYASTKWKKYILANSVKKKYTGKQCVFLYWHEDQIYNILARLSVLAHPSKKFICQYKMENNILATNVFLYWRRTNSQTYWQVIVYWQAHQILSFASTYRQQIILARYVCFILAPNNISTILARQNILGFLRYVCYPVIMHDGALRHARQYCIAQWCSQHEGLCLLQRLMIKGHWTTPGSVPALPAEGSRAWQVSP